jgi:hypothetical protein
MDLSVAWKAIKDIPPVLNTLISLAVGFLLARLQDWINSRTDKRKAAEALILPAQSVAQQLCKHLETFDLYHGNHPEELRIYFTLTESLIAERDLEMLQGGLHRGTALGVHCFDLWKVTIECLRLAQKRHDHLKSRSVLSGEQKGLAEAAPGYRQLVHKAINELCLALRGAQRYASSTTKRSIKKLLEED